MSSLVEQLVVDLRLEQRTMLTGDSITGIIVETIFSLNE
jgi:hypothetical protein